MTGSTVATPVVLFVFRRPSVTLRNLDVLREVRPERLFVVADGPRPGRTEDAEQVAAVRALVDDAVDWDCKVETRYAERNLGLEASIELGLDWVFTQANRAIVLEDDCIPDPTFFRFCDELLERYADEPRVWQISGDPHHVPTELFRGASYDFSTWASVWGWATWADRWHAHREEFNRDHAGAADRVDATPRTAPALTPDFCGAAPRLPRHPGRAAPLHSGRRRDRRRLAGVGPPLVGHDHVPPAPVDHAGGHAGRERRLWRERHAHAVEQGADQGRIDDVPARPSRPGSSSTEDIEGELELVLLRTDGQLSRLARRLIKPLWMRAIVRRIVTFPPVWRLVRRLVSK